MREIKFRAWNKKIKSMGSALPLDVLISDCTDINYDDLEIMQYTGLKDKNGKEIYEGDILSSEYTDLDPNNKNCHPVIWSHGRWHCDHKVNDCCKAWRGDLNGHHVSEEVIGNIYENPELIEK